MLHGNLRIRYESVDKVKVSIYVPTWYFEKEPNR